MISYGSLASAGSRVQFKQHIVVDLAAQAALTSIGTKGYSDRSNAYKALAKYCANADTQSTFYRVTQIDGRWFFIPRK
jgi:hypothetical protein